MASRICDFCQGVGTTRDGHACTYCGGYGKDPYASDDPPSRGPRGRRNSAPLPKSAQLVIIVVALIVGFAIYSLNGSNDAATGPAVLAFLGTLFAGYVLARFLSNPVPPLVLGVILLGIDWFFFDGTITLLVGAFLSVSWEHARDALLP